ncbi:MAG TPA: hypothetical protein VK966_11285 [Longimicrobiales bacterium]|nr:hypothetical protein [Longimicrobiales bacterium]
MHTTPAPVYHEVSMMPVSHRTFFLLVVAGLAACGPKHHLADYDFASGTLAVVASAPTYPDLHTGGAGAGDTDDGFLAVVNAGSRVAKEVSARQARARLDSAATVVDLGRRMGQRTADRVGRYLAVTPVDNGPADYTLEIWVTEFGLDASRRDAAATLYTESEAVLIDGASGREIWSTRVRAWDQVTPAVPTSPVPGDVVAAGTLMRLSVEDFSHSLERLADLASDEVTRELRDALRETRRR